ncbi:MAG: glycoside hydrolase family 30 protein [Ferruginibacter sp.]
MKTLLCIIFLSHTFYTGVAQGKTSYSSKKEIPEFKNRKVTVYTTAADTSLRLTETEIFDFKEYKQPTEKEPCVFIDPSTTFQSFIGIGGALTDAAAETYARLPLQQQREFMNAYYDKKKGIGYTLARTNISSCDFSSDMYTYVNDNDTSLATFNIAHDEQFRIPFIKKAIAAAGGKLLLYASPWSPPAWMKDNNDRIHGGKLLSAFNQSWAHYYVKFIKAYEAKGIPVWGLTVQNEPMAKQRWESCIFTAEDERDFIKNFLGPALEKEGLSDKKLIAWDHNRDMMYQRASVILNDADAAKYVWGIGFHWYETWTGGPMQFENLKLVSQAFPGKQLIFTEGCKEKFNIDSVYNWALGEKYGYSMINDFNNGTVAWTDWNVLLDEKGGPNHVGNFCFAPIHADTKNGKLIYTNAYYYIGHFSKFIRPGARRIASSANRAELQTTSFVNTDGSIAVIVMNTTAKKILYHLWMNSKTVTTESLPHSISTLIIK